MSEMIDMLMCADAKVSQFLERMTGGPIEDIDGAEDDLDLYFAMPGSLPGAFLQRPTR